MIDFSDVITLLLFYLSILNLFGFIMFFIDKQKAKRQAWRTPEATLISIALFGGSIGCLLGMYLFRHKTQKPKFYIGIPVILGVQVFLCLLMVFVLPFEVSIM